MRSKIDGLPAAQSFNQSLNQSLSQNLALGNWLDRSGWVGDAANVAGREFNRWRTKGKEF